MFLIFFFTILIVSFVKSPWIKLLPKFPLEKLQNVLLFVAGPGLLVLSSLFLLGILGFALWNIYLDLKEKSLNKAQSSLSDGYLFDLEEIPLNENKVSIEKLSARQQDLIRATQEGYKRALSEKDQEECTPDPLPEKFKKRKRRRKHRK